MEASTALLGKPTDFVAGAGQHTAYLKQGVFRMLVVYTAEKRDPRHPDIPILKDLGCEDVPANGYLVVGPKGMPEAVSKKLGEISSRSWRRRPSRSFRRITTPCTITRTRISWPKTSLTNSSGIKVMSRERG